MGIKKKKEKKKEKGKRKEKSVLKKEIEGFYEKEEKVKKIEGNQKSFFFIF